MGMQDLSTNSGRRGDFDGVWKIDVRERRLVNSSRTNWNLHEADVQTFVGSRTTLRERWSVNFGRPLSRMEQTRGDGE